MNKLIIITGPSCVGKSPLEKALRSLYPDLGLRLKKLVFYISRNKRPVETDGIDYHFRTRTEINHLAQKQKMVLIEARGDLHGFAIDDLRAILSQSDAFYEGNTFMADRLRTLCVSENIPQLSIFLTPLSMTELKQIHQKYTLPDAKKYVFEHMLQKQYRRAKKLGIKIDKLVQQNLEHRAGDAYDELAIAYRFDHIIVNHDGEDNPVWDNIDTLSGDALNAVNSVARIISGEEIPSEEIWQSLKFEP